MSRWTIDNLVHLLCIGFLNPYLATLVPLSLLTSTSLGTAAREFRISLAFAACLWFWKGLRRLDHWARQTSNDAIIWQDRVIVVTGASNGLGWMLTTMLASRYRGQYHVINLDLHAPSEPSPGVTFIACDVADAAAVHAAKKEILSQWKHIDVVVSCAGVLYASEIQRIDIDKLEHSLRVNVMAQFILAKEFLGDMRQGGQWITVGSTLGHVGVDCLAAYNVAKASLFAFHESLTAEVQRCRMGIETTLIVPGQLDTEMFARVTTPNSFLAPVVSVYDLANFMVDKIQHRSAGEFGMPFYANYMGVMRALPSGLAHVIRKFAGMNQAAVQLLGPRDKIQ